MQINRYNYGIDLGADVFKKKNSWKAIIDF